MYRPQTPSSESQRIEQSANLPVSRPEVISSLPTSDFERLLDAALSRQREEFEKRLEDFESGRQISAALPKESGVGKRPQDQATRPPGSLFRFLEDDPIDVDADDCETDVDYGNPKRRRIEDFPSLTAQPSRRRELHVQERQAEAIFLDARSRAPSVEEYINRLQIRSQPVLKECTTLARIADYLVDQFGAKAVPKIDALEILFRRLVAVLHGYSTGNWKAANFLEEQPEGFILGPAELYINAQRQSNLQQRLQRAVQPYPPRQDLPSAQLGRHREPDSLPGRQREPEKPEFRAPFRR